jgi:hypothetical protein
MFLVRAVPYILLASATVAANFSGKVVSVLDSDTLEVLHNQHPERIRLSGIDRPGPVSELIQATRSVVDSTGEDDAELCPNEKVVDETRFFDMRGCGGSNKSCQSHSVIGAHPDHVHRDPVLVNPSDFRQPDVYKGLFAFQP